MILIFFIICIIATNAVDEDYMINNEKCKMPKFPAFSEETIPLFVKLPYVKCSDKDLLTYTTVENNIAYLHIKQEALDQYYQPDDHIDCSYSYVRRNGSLAMPDLGVSYSPGQYFNSKVTLEEDTVMVRCLKDDKEVYKNVHAVIVVPEILSKRIQKLTETSEKLKKKPLSVLFVVIDGLGRLNLERTMPETKEYLVNNNFVEFIGYNKIDDATIPNFNALLTGFNLNQTLTICKPYEVGQLDKCPMIWYDFRDAGYATAYGEDWVEITTYLHSGFQNPPTDYYLKPYMEAAKDLGPHEYLNDMPYCAGPESQGERILKNTRDFALAFKNQPSFGIFWMNTFSHNHINSPPRMDGKIKTFFENLKQDGILDDSMVILLADHGIREGEIRVKIQGFYEERLPINMISLPPWFQKEYPEKYKNLKNNAHKLTSTYDLYMTLQEILSLATPHYKVTASSACSTCQSMFSEIPEVRSCAEAGIPEEYCTCIDRLDKSDPNLTPAVTEAAIQFIKDSNILRSSERNITKVISTSVSHFNHKTYFLIAFETGWRAHLCLIKGTVKPTKFETILKYIEGIK